MKSHYRLSFVIIGLLKQRIYAIAAGYEDINDHETPHEDSCFQLAIAKEKILASQSTLSRFENSLDRPSLVALSQMKLFPSGHIGNNNLSQI